VLSPETAEQAVLTTFEEMAFLDVAAGPSGSPAPAEEGPWLFLSYTRPKAGSFALFLPKAIKFSVAESIYGDDWKSLSPGQLDDSLLELMNVLAGRLLTGRFGPSMEYTMGLPTVLYDPPGDLEGFERWNFPFHVDQNEFMLVWYEVSA